MLNKKDLVSNIMDIVKENLMIDDQVFTEESDLIHELQFDSMDIVSLGIEIEDAYGVNLSHEDFASIDVTPAAVADLIISRVNATEMA